MELIDNITEIKASIIRTEGIIRVEEERIGR